MKRHISLCVSTVIMLALSGTALGMSFERVGPDPETVAQRDWGKGVVELARHPTRVYSLETNGFERFYFLAKAEEVNELLALFAKIDMSSYELWQRSQDGGVERLMDADEHEARVCSGPGRVSSFDGNPFDFNVAFELPSGLYLAVVRGALGGERPADAIVRPRLTIHLEPGRVAWGQLKIPENVVLKDAGDIKAIGPWRRSGLRPFALGRAENVNLFYPTVADAGGRPTYPVVIEAAQFDKVGENLQCSLTVAEDASAKGRFDVGVSVFSAKGERKKSAALQGQKKYTLDLGPQALSEEPKEFAVTIERREPWGKAAQGLQARLTADKELFTDAEVVSFVADVRSDGPAEVTTADGQSAFELLIDGKTYQWRPKKSSEASAGDLRLGAGEKPRSQAITVNEDEWLSAADGRYLKIGPGEHQAHVVAKARRGADARQVTSNTVRFWVKKAIKKQRGLFHGRVLFDDGSPAVAKDLRLWTHITKWDDGVAEGASIAELENDGYFTVGISDEVMKRLESGKSWLTIHFARHTRDVGRRNEQRFPVELLAAKRDQAGVMKISRPQLCYGRILYQDGTPATKARPEGNMYIVFATGVDDQGYFSLYLSDEELKELQARSATFEVYHPTGKPGEGVCIARFPAAFLSRDKSKAGELRLQRLPDKAEIDLADAPSLVGKALPAFDGIEVEFAAASAKGKKVLVCFWDMEQRPSRHCIMELAKRAEELKGKGLAVVAIQAVKVDEKALKDWVAENKVPFPVGIIKGDVEKVRFAWGAKSLPWLILTDADHTVRSEGFGLSEIGEP